MIFLIKDDGNKNHSGVKGFHCLEFFIPFNWEK